MKFHFSVNGSPLCGRGARLTSVPRQVTCLVCQRADQFLAALNAENAERHKAFMAQTPREFREPWRDGNVVCRECGGTEFRMGDRTCYGHYENYHCASCGHVESRLTETGMSY